MSSDVLTFGDWDVTFTDGAAVSSISSHILHTDLLLKNLSSQVTNQMLQAEIAQFGSEASVMRDSRRKRARIRFLDAEPAKQALAVLDSKRLGPSRIEVTLDRTKDLQWIEDGILLSYDTCETTASVSFLTAEEATEALGLNRSMFQGRRLRVTQESETRLLVEELPAIFDEDDLLTFFGAQTIEITRDFGEDSDIHALLQALIREQPGCASLHVVPLPAELGRGAGWIRMYNEERVKEVATEVRGLRPIFLGGNVVQAHRAQCFVWKVSPEHIHAVYSLLDELEIEGAYLKYDAKATEEQEVRLVASDLRKLRAAHCKIDVIINGMVWTNGGPIWDRHWVSEEGRAFIQEVNQVSTAYVRANMFERIVRIAGREEAKDCAIAMLQSYLDKLDKERHLIKLPKELMQEFITHGLPRLGNSLYHFDSTIGKRQDVEFKGSDDARQQLYLVLDQCATEVSLRSRGGDRPTCGICTTTVTDPLELECGHVYCAECVIHLVTSAVDFPVQCIVENCNYAPSLRVLRRIAPPPQYRRMLEISFRSHLRGSTQYFPCPTIDCPQLWNVNSHKDPSRRITQCSTCLICICMACKVEEHTGMTCAEYQRSRAYHAAERDMATWRATRGAAIKTCPSCGCITERIDGCPHIHCTQCNAHWCWECRRVFPRIELVYSHIRRRHILAARQFLAPAHLER